LQTLVNAGDLYNLFLLAKMYSVLELYILILDVWAVNYLYTKVAVDSCELAFLFLENLLGEFEQW